MDADPHFLLSHLEIGRLPVRQGARGNELVVELEGGPDFELPLELINLDPFAKDLETQKSLSSASEKSHITASRLGVMDSETLPDLSFLQYVPKRRARQN